MVKRPYTKQAAHLICKNPNCPQKSTRLTLVEERLIQALSAWLENYKLSVEEVATAMAPERTQAVVHEKLLRSIDEEIAQIDKQRDNLHNLLERGVYDDATYLERNQKLLRDLARLREQRETVKAELERLEELHKARLNVVPRVSGVLDAYRMTDDVARKNELLKSVLEKAVYNKEKWQQGDQFELMLFPLV